MRTVKNRQVAAVSADKRGMDVWFSLRIFLFAVFGVFVFSMPAASQSLPTANSGSADGIASAARPDGSSGYAVWSSPSRFYEFSADGSFRIVLKPYYSFVYEPAVPMTWSCVPVPETGDCIVAIDYLGNKSSSAMPLFVHKSGIYFNFFICTVPDVAGKLEERSNSLSADSSLLNGFWQQTGNRDMIRLYDDEPHTEIFCWYFHDNRFQLIRYWKTDLEYRHAAAVVANNGDTFEIPRFLQKDGFTYSCVTINEKTVHHYWSGTYTLDTGHGEIILYLEAVNRPKNPELSPCPIFKNYTAEHRDDGNSVYTIPIVRSAGSLLFALGDPDAVPHDFANQDTQSGEKQNPLDGLITAHNSLRRPPRKPFFDYMELDFHWDEVQALSAPELEYMRKYLSEFTVPLFGDSFFRELQN